MLHVENLEILLQQAVVDKAEAQRGGAHDSVCTINHRIGRGTILGQMKFHFHSTTAGRCHIRIVGACATGQQHCRQQIIQYFSMHNHYKRKLVSK